MTLHAWSTNGGDEIIYSGDANLILENDAASQLTRRHGNNDLITNTRNVGANWKM